MPIKNSAYLSMLCMTQSLMGMEASTIQIRLKDKNSHNIPLHVLQTSTVLIKKEIERAKTTVDLVKKWGFSEHDYDTFQQKPLNLSHIHSKQFSLFTQFLSYDQDTWSKKFYELNEKQQDDIVFITSDQGLGVPLFLAHLTQIIVPPETIEAHIAPYLETKDIVSYLRNRIIVHNAQHTPLPQTTQSLGPHEQTIQFNDMFNQCMIVPSSIIKNKSYRFCGAWENARIMLEGEEWLIYVLKHRSDGLSYMLTSSISCENIMLDDEESYFIWLIDKEKKIIDKKSIPYGGFLRYLLFSSNAQYFVMSTKTVSPCYQNTLSLLKIKPEAAVIDYEVTYSYCPAPCITALCFNKKSTILATGTKGDHTNKNIILRNAHTGDELSSACTLPGKIKRLCFNNRDTQMIAFLANNADPDSSDTVIIFNVANPTQIKTILSHHIPCDSMHDPDFSPNDEFIAIKLTNGRLLFIDGITGKIINATENPNDYCPQQIASVFYADNRLLVSALLAGYCVSHGDAFLWDAQEPITTLIYHQAGLSGIGFSPNKRHVVATCQTKGDNSIITTELFDHNTHNALQWLKHDTSLVQKYALYWLYKAHQKKVTEAAVQLPYIIYHALSSLPNNVCNAHEIIYQHFYDLSNRDKIWRL